MASKVDLFPVFDAAEKGQLKRLKKLLQNSEDKNPQDNNGETLLHHASGNGHLNVVKFIIPFLRDKNPKEGLNKSRKLKIKIKS